MIMMIQALSRSTKDYPNRPFTLMDPAFVCFSDDQLRLSGSQLEHFLNTVVFPPLCAFGIVGNTLTIMVLVSNDLMS
ncbi:hypothetical protein TELCIR_12130, partial [Teladorsagia circumcincta]